MFADDDAAGPATSAAASLPLVSSPFLPSPWFFKDDTDIADSFLDGDAICVAVGDCVGFANSVVERFSFSACFSDDSSTTGFSDDCITTGATVVVVVSFSAAWSTSNDDVWEGVGDSDKNSSSLSTVVVGCDEGVSEGDE